MPGSSPEADTEIEVDPVDADANAAETSSGSEVEGAKPSLLDSVREAINSDEQSPGSQERDPVDLAAPKPAETPVEPELGDVTEAELKSYGPKTQRRIKGLLAQRSDLSTKLSQAEPKARQFDEIDQFARQNRLTPEEVKISLEIGASLRNDPFKAKARLAPIMAKLEELTGGVLPPELQERVNLGFISENDAKDLVAARKQLELNQGQSAEQRKDQEEAEQARQRTALVDDARKTGNDWETAKKASDPDWPLKQERIAELIKIEVYEKGFPSTKQAVTTMLEGIYGKVTKEIARFKPPPRQVRPGQSASASSRATSEPKTAVEAARLALAR